MRLTRKYVHRSLGPKYHGSAAGQNKSGKERRLTQMGIDERRSEEVARRLPLANRHLGVLYTRIRNATQKHAHGGTWAWHAIALAVLPSVRFG
jgi:hypothetical protein